MRHDDQHANRYYTVRRGDTLSEIASENRTSVGQLLAQNDLGRHGRIYPGQVLQLPDRPGTAPKRIVPPVAITAQAEPLKTAGPALPVADTKPSAPATPATEVAIAVSQSLEKAPAPPEPAPAPPQAIEPAPGEPIAALEPAGAPPSEAEGPSETVEDEEAPFSDEDLGGVEPKLAAAAPPPTAPAPKLTPAPAKPAPVTVALAEPAVTPEQAAAAPSSAGDDSPYRRIDKDRVLVDDDETLGHFADWLEVTPQRLRNLNKLKGRQPIHVGQKLRLDFGKVSAEEFQQRRLEYHKGIEEDFFGSYRVTSTVEHSLRPGDTLWVLSHKLYGVPTWLIHRYNPDVDFAKLVPGTKLQIPVVEKLG
jgi:peptidoglycan lytic transglycosylase D